MAEIQVMKNILGENDRVAAENQALFAEKNVYVINLMGSPGAGKTSVLEKTMEKLKDKLKMAVIEVSCTKDQGLDEWCEWLLSRVAAKQKKGE